MSESVPTINRVAVVLEPKEPYLDWARNLDGDDPTIDTMSRENLTTVYLIEDDAESEEEPLRRHWDWIFAENLHSWHTDPRLWPQNRTYAMFKEWFDVRIVDIVYDLAEGRVTCEDV